jgi:hypothetical protein
MVRSRCPSMSTKQDAALKPLKRRPRKKFGSRVIAADDLEGLYNKVTWILKGYGYSPENWDEKRADGWFHLLLLVARDFVPDHKPSNLFDLTWLFGRGGPGRPKGTKKWDDMRLAELRLRYFQIKDKQPKLNDKKICGKIIKNFPGDYPEKPETLRRQLPAGRRWFERRGWRIVRHN